MKDKDKTKDQLIHELAAMRQRIAEFEKSEGARKGEEQRLHEIEEMFRLFMKHSPIYVFFKDENIRAIQLSENYERMLGRPVQELLSKTMEELFPSELAESMTQDDLRILCEGKPIEVVEELNGRTYTTTKFPILRGGKPPLLAGFTMEITERKQAEEALLRAKQEWERTFDAVPDLIMILDNHHRIRHANRAMAQRLGRTPEQCVEEICHKVVHGLDSPPEACPHVLSMADGRSHVAEVREDRLAGDFWVSTTPLVDEQDRLIGTVHVARDITERKHEEKELQQSEERFRELYDHAPLGYHEYDTEGRITRVNRTDVEMLGYAAEELIGQYIWKLNVDEDAVRQQVLAKLAGTLPLVPSLERTYRRKDGTTFPVLCQDRLILDENGRIRGIRSTVQDVTELKKIEEQRRRLEERLSRAEKMEALGTLSGGVAHDLNNVLGVLVGYSELLLMEMGKTNPLRSHVSYISQASQRAAAIIQDLLTLARRGVVVSDVFNLSKVISDCLKSPEFERLKNYHPQVAFETVLDKDLMNIKGSPVHLGKTVMNLLSNAAEAVNADGQVTLVTENRYLDKPMSGYEAIREGDYVVLKVSDSGKGIPKQDLGKIFEPFYTKKAMGRSGTGLGLAVVWGTVKDHGGYIDVQSEEGKGSTFTLYFPVTREEKISDQQIISAESYMGRGESLLVVDDVKEQRDLATTLLSALGYRVSAASSGEEALTYLQTHRVDLLVLDMILGSEMDGLETYQKALEINPRQKAIIVSGFSETDRVRTAQALGAGAYIRKPYILEKIGLAIRKELDK